MAWKVSEVMTKEVVTVGPEADFKVCVDLLRVHEISALPVVDGDYRVLGIVSEADLLLKEERHDSRDHLKARQKRKAIARTAADVMSKPVWSVGQSASLAEAARLMHNKAVKRLPVVDAGGMSADPAAAYVEEELAPVVRRMAVLGVRHLPAIDDDGEVIGMISARDLLAAKGWAPSDRGRSRHQLHDVLHPPA